MIYLTNGNMPLNAAYADEIVQEDNSTYQLSFRFPTSDSLWEQLKEETFLTADDLHGEQDFVIFEVEKKHGYIQVYANQVFTLLNNYVVNPISLDRQTGSTALSRFAGSITRDNPFSFFSDIEDRHTFNVGSKNAMEVFAKDKHSIIGQWGGNLVRHGYQVRLLKNGGSENESLFMYKKNLSSYQHKTSTKSLKTRITFIATVKGEGEKAPDRTFTVTIDSPLINKYSQIYEDVIEVNDQDVKDEASLRKYGEQYYRTSLCDMMEDSLELDVVGQSDVPVQMYDIVSLFHEVYNLDVRKKITKYIYSPMAKKLKSIGFGQFQSGLANAIGNAVSDAVKGEAQQLQSNFEQQLARELKNADLAFDRRKEELVKQFTDDVNAINAKAEETKQEIFDSIGGSFELFRENLSNSVQVLTDKALEKAGASSLLAQEAKRIGFDAIARLEAITNPQNGLIATQIANYKTAVDGRFADITSLIAGKANQIDFQRVKETSQLYERILGNTENGIADKVARMALTNQLFQVEVAKASASGRNLFLSSTATKGYLGRAGVINVANSIQKEITSDFISVEPNEKIIFQHWVTLPENGMAFTAWQFFDENKNPIDARITGSNAYKTATGKQHNINQIIVPANANFIRVSARMYNDGLIKIERGSAPSNYSVAPEDTDEAIRTIQSQLAGSWAVQNLTSAGSIVSQINATNNQILIEAEKIRLKGKTLLDELTAIQGYFKRLFVGEGTFATLNADVIRTNSITADKLVINEALANRLVSNEIITSKLVASRAFVNALKAVTIDASQIVTGTLRGDRIYGGVIRGTDIYGATLTGHTKIQLGSYGSFDTVNGGLQINVPRDYNAKDGLGVQFIGSYGRGENVPYGLFIYKDSDLTTDSTALQSDDFLMTVEGYIKAKGIGWFKTDTGSVNGKLTATIGLWNSNNVCLSFGGSGNDIYYSYNGTAYSLWSVINQHFSDRRLKENIIDCEHKALDYIHQFKFKEYDWKKQEDRPQQAHTKIGLIAQEVQAVDPTLVYKNGDTLNLDNLRLTTIALKAIQELSQRIETLERKLA